MEVYEPNPLPRLSPAFTPAQRLHLELRGYVVVENTLSPGEVETLRSATLDIEAHVRAGHVPPRPAFVHSGGERWFRVDNVPHLHPAFLDHLTNPLLLGMAEEAIGGDARLEQSDIHVHRRAADGSQEGSGLHRGAFQGMSWTQSGLTHFPFVKTLTLLTDVGPDDGGTVVVPGSHRVEHIDTGELTAIIERQPELVEQVVAPAGSTVFFYESTIHGAGDLRSDNERVFIVGGYAATMHQTWHEYDLDPAWIASLPDRYRVFLSGSNRWLWQTRVRDLNEPKQELAAAIADAEARAAAGTQAAERERLRQAAVSELRP